MSTHTHTLGEYTGTSLPRVTLALLASAGLTSRLFTSLYLHSNLPLGKAMDGAFPYSVMNRSIGTILVLRRTLCGPVICEHIRIPPAMCDVNS